MPGLATLPAAADGPEGPEGPEAAMQPSGISVTMKRSTRPGTRRGQNSWHVNAARVWLARNVARTLRSAPSSAKCAALLLGI